MNAFTSGTKVTHVNRRTGAVLRGRIVSVEHDAYDTVVNGVIVYYVRWEGLGIGGGWRHDDLVAA